MTEVRPVRRDECPAFLELLCSVFELDQHRAQSVFYSEPFFDLSRKWAYFYEGRIVTILTTTPLIFGWGRAIGISGVASDPSVRGRGFAHHLIGEVLRRAEEDGEGAAMLFARDPRLYEDLGFRHVDRVIEGPVIAEDKTWDECTSEFVVERYQRWADGDEGRLRRDEQRWSYWNWGMRLAERFQDGYLCHEVGVVREALFEPSAASWPVGPDTMWRGLESMTREFGVPLEGEREEVLVYTRGFPTPPQMFLTDQF